jgi:uncharacterized protein (TIGR04255 family)
MSPTRHYPQAPVTEAIIDLRVGPSTLADEERCRQVCEAIARDYPQREQLIETGLRFEFRPAIEPSTSTLRELAGYRATSGDAKQILQARRQGFTFSRLAPYDRWEVFRDEARRLWNIYRRITTADQVTRVAIRTINRIDIPGDSVDLQAYFRTAPQLSTDLPQQLDSFFLRLQLPFPGLPGHAIINQTIVPPARPGVVSVVLDIDLFRVDNLPAGDVELWEIFESLHTTKNDIFEACITDVTRSLFGSCLT